MKVQIFGNPLVMAKELFSFVKPVEVEIVGTLDAQAIAVVATQLGMFKGKTFQSTGDDNGSVIIGQRFKPMVIAIPEGHPKFGTQIVMSRKLPPVKNK